MTESLNNTWSTRKKFVFLFLLCYTFFYLFPFPFDAFPQLDFIFNYYEKATNRLVLFIGKRMLHIQGLTKLTYSDSGDTLFDFVRFYIFLVLSFLSAIVIMIADKKRPNYEKMQAYVFVYIRYCIGLYMLVYGFDKVFKSHFPFPSLEKLGQPIGDSSPQGLLWAFMGYSTPYTVYLGIIEVLSGFLLFFRRTTAAGTLLVLMIMINVTIINFSYDVPVKLFALHMVIYAFILLSPFLNSIFSFFFLKNPSQLPEQRTIVFPNFVQKYRTIFKAVVVIAYTTLFISFSITNMKTDGDASPNPPLYGIYRFSGSNIPGAEKLREIIFDKKIAMLKWDDQYSYYTVKVDTIAKTIAFQSNKDARDHNFLRYDFAENILTLFQDDTTSSQYRKVDLNEFPLIRTKFRWVREYPFNN